MSLKSDQLELGFSIYAGARISVEKSTRLTHNSLLYFLYMNLAWVSSISSIYQLPFI